MLSQGREGRALADAGGSVVWRALLGEDLEKERLMLRENVLRFVLEKSMDGAGAGGAP